MRDKREFRETLLLLIPVIAVSNAFADKPFWQLLLIAGAVGSASGLAVVLFRRYGSRRPGA